MKKIPIKRVKFKLNGKQHDYNWINYGDDKVFIIKLGNEGNIGDFQYDGVSCKHGSVRGFVYKEFQIKAGKYFNPDWWYKRTIWSEDPKKIYFDPPKNSPINSNYNYRFRGKGVDLKKLDKHWEGIRRKVTKLATPCIDILISILRIIRSKTGVKFYLDFSSNEYGVNWFEAYIPLIDEVGNKYLLTWRNCD